MIIYALRDPRDDAIRYDVMSPDERTRSMYTGEFDPTTFEPVEHASRLLTCLRCQATVPEYPSQKLHTAAMRHHDWHVALDDALASAGASYGALMRLNSINR